MSADRVGYIDRLRVLGCLAVVLLHVFSGVLDSLGNQVVVELGMLRAVCWGIAQVILTRWAVPVFLMMTGALLLNPAKQLERSKNAAYICRALAAIVLFGTCYALMEIVFSSGRFEPIDLLLALLNVAQEQSWSHMWYLYDLLGIYLLLPLLRAYCTSAERRDLSRTIGILFVFSLVVPTLNSVLEITIHNPLWLTSSVFYVLLGRYLSAYCTLNRQSALAGAAAALALGVLTVASMEVDGGIAPWICSPSSPLVAVWSCCVFLSAKRWMNAPIGGRCLLARLPTLSFGVYLVHPVFLNVLYKVVGWQYLLRAPVLAETLTFFFVFLASSLSAAVLKRLPVVRRIL